MDMERSMYTNTEIRAKRHEILEVNVVKVTSNKIWAMNFRTVPNINCWKLKCWANKWVGRIDVPKVVNQT